MKVKMQTAARAGFIEIVSATDFGNTGLWIRVNALNSPWFLDDMTQLVEAVGNKLDVIMIPKVEGAWDIHFVDGSVVRAHQHAAGARRGEIDPESELSVIEQV